MDKNFTVEVSISKLWQFLRSVLFNFPSKCGEFDVIPSRKIIRNYAYECTFVLSGCFPSHICVTLLYSHLSAGVNYDCYHKKSLCLICYKQVVQFNACHRHTTNTRTNSTQCLYSKSLLFHGERTRCFLAVIQRIIKC